MTLPVQPVHTYSVNVESVGLLLTPANLLEKFTKVLPKRYLWSGTDYYKEATLMYVLATDRQLWRTHQKPVMTNSSMLIHMERKDNQSNHPIIIVEYIKDLRICTWLL